MTILAGQRVTSLRANDGHPRYLNYTAITSSSSVNTTTTDVVAITTPPITFRNGRAFRLVFKGNVINGAASDQLEVDIRPTSLSGTPILLDSQRFATGAVVGSYGFVFENIISNTSGADVSRVLVGCHHKVTGTSSQVGVVANNPAFISVEDIGDATDFPSASSLT